MDFMQLAAAAIDAERRRQVEEEGRTAEHDAQYRQGELALAGQCYKHNARRAVPSDEPPPGWPWGREWWKPRGVERDLIRAGALFKAELDRLNSLHGQDRRLANRPFLANADLGECVEMLAVLYRFAAERAATPDADERPDEFDIDDAGHVTALPTWQRNNEAIFMRLQLGSAYPTEEEVAAWTVEQAREADVWACAVMLSASDNDDIQVPPRPDFLPNRRWIPGDSLIGPGTIVDA